jgi:hypothetical protein
VARELAVTSWQSTVSHFLFTREFVDKNNMTVAPPIHPTHLTGLCFPDWQKNWEAAILTELRLSRQNHRTLT